jgi:hypothetical protein
MPGTGLEAGPPFHLRVCTLLGQTFNVTVADNSSSVLAVKQRLLALDPSLAIPSQRLYKSGEEDELANASTLADHGIDSGDSIFLIQQESIRFHVPDGVKEGFGYTVDEPDNTTATAMEDCFAVCSAALGPGSTAAWVVRSPNFRKGHSIGVGCTTMSPGDIAGKPRSAGASETWLFFPANQVFWEGDKKGTLPKYSWVQDGGESGEVLGEVRFEIDFDAGTLSAALDNRDIGVVSTTLRGQTVYPCVYFNSQGACATVSAPEDEK